MPRHRSPPALQDVLDAYALHQQRTRGLRPRTLCGYQYAVRQFVRAALGEDPVDLACLRPPDVLAFIRTMQQRYCPSTIRTVGGALRSFFRYLRAEGICDAALEAAVPTIARWKLAALPRGLTNDQYKRLIASFRTTTMCGVRDRAMVLCLGTLGLRAGEVANLRLDDIDWRTGTLRLRTRKSRRGAVLPLPREAGRAIASYLRQQRPPSSDRHVFLRHGGRRNGEGISAGIVTGVVIRGLRRAGIDSPIAGAHVLRHTFATRMVQQGTRLKEVADLLGHQDLRATTIYAKLDLPSLREVALPWPEVTP